MFCARVVCVRRPVAWLVGIGLVCAGVFLYVSNAHADAQSRIAKANNDVDVYRETLAGIKVAWSRMQRDARTRACSA